MTKFFSLFFIKRHWYTISVLLILAASFFLRFHNYSDRLGLSYDQAHDAIVAKYALENGKIPLVGPFSSAGPFQAGGEWYWFIMLGELMFSWTVFGPWILLTLSSILFVYLLIKFCTKLVDRKFGVLVGLLAAVSPAQIYQSLNLTNQSPLAFVALLAMFASLSYVRTKSAKYLFFLGYFVSLASSIHLQGTLLFVLVLITLLGTGRPTIKGILVLLLGIIIPFIPMLIFDFKNDFINSQNILRYYLHDQYKISLDVLGRRWLTVITVFWPKIIANIVGGNIMFSIILLVLFVIDFAYKATLKKMTREFYIFLASLIGMVIILRYIRTPIFDSYVVFMHPLIFILLGWTIYSFLKINRLLFIVSVFLLVFGSIYVLVPSLFYSQNSTANRVVKLTKLLDLRYKNQKFAVFDYKYTSVEYSFPLVLYLQHENKISDDGYRLGLDGMSRPSDYMHPEIFVNRGIANLRDLESSSSSELAKDDWSFINPSMVYASTQEWRKQ